MQIAICDDVQLYISQLTAELNELAAETETEIKIDVFRNFSYLAAAIKEKRYDLLLLETNLHGVNGIEFARNLRLQKNDAEIIFVTSNPDYALQAYSVFPIGYIVKPPMKRRLRAPFRRAAEKFSHRCLLILNDPDGGKVTVAADDILYVEVIGAELILHCRNRTVKCSGSLVDTYQKLPAKQFYRSHRSYIVNMNYIVRAAKYYFVMDNSDKVTIAKNRYAEAKEKLSEFAGD